MVCHHHTLCGVGSKRGWLPAVVGSGSDVLKLNATKYCSVCGVTCGFHSIHSEGIHIPETSAPQVPVPANKCHLLASSTVSTSSGSHHSLINQTPMKLSCKYRQIPLQNTSILA